MFGRDPGMRFVAVAEHIGSAEHILVELLGHDKLAGFHRLAVEPAPDIGRRAVGPVLVAELGLREDISCTWSNTNSDCPR